MEEFMKWEDRRRSSNVRRGPSVNNNRGGLGGGPVYRGGFGRSPVRIGGGCGSIFIILLLLLLSRGLFSFDSGSTYNDKNYNQNQYEQRQQPTQTSPNRGGAQSERERREDFLSVVLADTEDVWHEKFKEMGSTYSEPVMVPFTGSTRSACGVASSDMGPFYCPLDESIYIDAGFYDDLVNRFGGGGDFAFAYVLAHEVGHHVQNELGIIDQTNKLRQTLSKKDYNRVSVAQELQADYFAGLFAYYIEEKGYLEPGDIDEAMQAAAAIGDDRIQEMSGRNVNVDTFTHGSSAQRKEAFDLGYKYHDINHSMKWFDELGL